MPKWGGWEAVRGVLRQRIGAAAFERWFAPVEAALEAQTLVLHCPDRFSRDWVERRYGRLLGELRGAGHPIEYRVAAESGRSNPGARDRPPGRPPARPQTTAPPEPGFEAFVAGPGNVLALEAARAVARGQAGHCIPLVLAGGSGLGKTHLCRALRRALGEGTVYRSSEEFTTEVTGALRSGQMDAFRQRYRRSLNVLILEDVQFFAGKRATQVELFHTLDHLLTSGKPVVLSAERAPQEIDGLDPKLASRMSSGLVACITPPEHKTRRAILREKAAGGGVRLPDDCLELLAARPIRSVRDLLAGLNQVVARAALLQRSISIELVEEALAAVAVPGRSRSIEEIIELVARACGTTLEELRGRSRRRSVVRPRQVAMYLARRYTDASLKEIGGAFGRDHSGVLYSLEAVEKRVAERPQLRYELEALVARISPPAGSDGDSTRGTRRT